MKHPYLQLLWKEFRQAAPLAAVFLLVLAAWFVFLYSRIGHWHQQSLMVFAFMPFGFIPFWTVWRGYESFRKEWVRHHQHLLMMLPVPSWYLTSAKLLVSVLEVAVYGLLIGLANVYFGGVGYVILGVDGTGESLSRSSGLEPETLQQLTSGWLWAMASVAVPLALLAAALGIVLSQWSWAAGQLFRRGRRVVSNIAFLAGIWFVLRLVYLVSLGLSWLPPVRWANLPVPEGPAAVSYVGLWISPAPLLGVIAAGALAFWATGRLLERVLEV